MLAMLRLVVPPCEANTRPADEAVSKKLDPSGVAGTGAFPHDHDTYDNTAFVSYEVHALSHARCLPLRPFRSAMAPYLISGCACRSSSASRVRVLRYELASIVFPTPARTDVSTWLRPAPILSFSRYHRGPVAIGKVKTPETFFTR